MTGTCVAGGREVASRSPAAVWSGRRGIPAQRGNDSAASIRWLRPCVAGYARDEKDFQDHVSGV